MKTKITILALLLTASLTAQIPVDKQYHIGAGAYCGVWGTFAGNSMEWTPEQAALFGIASATVAGIGKELWDVSYRLWGYNDKFDPMDVAATVAGGIIGTGLSYAALKIFKKKPPIIYGMADRRGVQIGIKLQLIK